MTNWNSHLRLPFKFLSLQSHSKRKFENSFTRDTPIAAQTLCNKTPNIHSNSPTWSLEYPEVLASFTLLLKSAAETRTNWQLTWRWSRASASRGLQEERVDVSQGTVLSCHCRVFQAREGEAVGGACCKSGVLLEDRTGTSTSGRGLHLAGLTMGVLYCLEKRGSKSLCWALMDPDYVTVGFITLAASRLCRWRCY